MHAPDELKVMVVTDTTNEDVWSWCRWLPHGRWAQDEEFNLLGNDPLSVQQRLQELTGLIQSRREHAQQNHSAKFSPAVVVVFDDATRWMSAGFADIVRDGPSYGIYSVGIDAERPLEGVGAKIASGSYGDDAVAEIVGHPPVAGLVLDGFWIEFGDQVARRLASIRPSTTDRRSDLPASVRLIDLLGLGTVNAKAISEGWARRSRSSGAVVGVSDGDQSR